MNVDANKIRHQMALRLMSQRDLAEAAQISEATVSDTLSKGRCSVGTARKIAIALEIDPQELAVKERSTKWH